MNARIISVASVMMTLPMRVPTLPDRGGAVVASTITTSVGGAFNVMRAAASQGVDVVNTCPLGTGPNSALVRQAMEDAGISTVSSTVVGDTGMKLVLLEADGHTTSLLSPGVEAEIQATNLSGVDIRTGDIVYVSAGDLLYPSYYEALCEWLPTLPADVRIAFAASPLIDRVPTDWLRRILPFCQVVTMNQREGAILSDRFEIKPGTVRFAIAAELPQDCIIVRRSGADGCTVKVGVDDEVHRIEPYETKTSDTIGVGETHIGVLIANLANGADPIRAAELANAAAAVAISIPGAPWCPGIDVLEKIVAHELNVADIFGG